MGLEQKTAQILQPHCKLQYSRVLNFQNFPDARNKKRRKIKRFSAVPWISYGINGAKMVFF
jgi:hypothetical protein